MRRSTSGFTLMEILLALTILLVGIVGILSLFQTGLIASKSAIQDTTAAMIAESVHSALKTAFKGWDGTNTGPFVHDGVPTGTTLQLPTVGNTKTFPAANDVWHLGQGATADIDISRSDTKQDGLNQYSFDLVITYTEDAANPGQPMVDGLYDIQIRIFRNFNVGGLNNKNACPPLVKIFYTQMGVQ